MGNRKIYICFTYYHVLVTLVKEIMSEAEVDIVICDTIPEYQKLVESIKSVNLFTNIYYFSEKKYQNKNILNTNKNSKLRLLLVNQRIKNNIITDFSLGKSNYDEVNIYHDWTYIGYYLRANRIKYNLLEDAKDSFKVLDNYVKVDYKKTIKNRILGYVYETLFFHGKSKYAKVIEINDYHGTNLPKDKVRVKSKKDMFEKLSDEEKQKIYNVFIRDKTNIDFQAGYSILILTQPLYQDNMVESNEIQKRVYEDILSEHCSDGNVFIKPHPRDDFDYSNHFSNVTVIDKNIPIEVLDFNPKVKIMKAITISSSSIYGIDFVEEKIYLGFEWLKKYN